MFQTSVVHRDYWQFADVYGEPIHICLSDISAFGKSPTHEGSYIVAGGVRHEVTNTVDDICETFRRNNMEKALL